MRALTLTQPWAGLVASGIKLDRLATRDDWYARAMAAHTEACS